MRLAIRHSALGSSAAGPHHLPPTAERRAPSAELPGSGAVARNFLALGGAEIAARVLAFVATVYAARVLGATAYGVVGFATAVMLYFAHLATFGVDVVGVQLVAEDRGRVATLAPSLLVARLLFAAALAGVVAAASLAILPHPDGAVMALFALGLLPVAANARWIHIGLERTGVASVARVAGDACALALLVVLVRGPADVVRVPAAQLVGGVLAAAILLAWLWRWGYALRPRLAWDQVRSVARRAWPLTVYGLLGLLLYNADLIFLRIVRGNTAAGYYTAAYTLISFLGNLGLAYATSLLPALSRLGVADGGRQALYQTASAHVFAGALPAAVGGFLLAPQIIGVVFGTAYTSAVPALQVLIWSVPLSVMRDLPFVALVASAREDRLLRLNTITVICSLAMMLVLVPRYGLVGAAWATLGTELLRLTIAIVFARAEGYRLPGIERYWRAAVAAAAMALLLVTVRDMSLWSGLAAGTLCYLFALTLLGGLRLRRGLPELTV